MSEFLTPFNVALLAALAFMVWLTLDLRALLLLAACIFGPVLVAVGVAGIVAEVL